jgi:drug/metabolite transporter (DMT)-like permease
MQSAQKLAAARGLSASRLVLVSALTVASLGAAATTARGAWVAVDLMLVGLAAANAAFYTSGTVLLLRALRRSSTAAVLPLMKLDGLLVVAIGALAFAERPTPLQWVGALLGLGVVAALTWPARGAGDGRPELHAVASALGAACSFAGSMTIGRLAARSGEKLPYVAISYAITALLALAVGALTRPEGGQTRAALPWGAVIGALNFVGYLLLLHSFAHGPMTLVQSIFASSMLVAVAVSSRLLREKLTRRHAVALSLSLGAVVLIRLGG